MDIGGGKLQTFGVSQAKVEEEYWAVKKTSAASIQRKTTNLHIFCDRLNHLTDYLKNSVGLVA